MKFKYTHKETSTVVGKIKDVLLKRTKNGADLVVLTMQDGKIFSNFKDVWDRIGIDINGINEGDELEIEYSTSIYKTPAHNKRIEYHNFWNIVLKPKKEATSKSDYVDTVLKCFNERKADENRLSDR